MTTLDEIQAEVAKIAERMELSPIQIPPELAEMPAVEAVQMRIQSLVQNIGGYAALAASVPCHTAKMWQNKIEAVGRFKLLMNDFEVLSEFFKDSVLIALMGHKFGLASVDLSGVPPSDYSIADLSWALRRYQAQTQLLACDLREKQMSGESTLKVEAQLAQIAKESIILLKQFDLGLQAISPNA